MPRKDYKPERDPDDLQKLYDELAPNARAYVDRLAERMSRNSEIFARRKTRKNFMTVSKCQEVIMALVVKTEGRILE
jgi:hypothetical protein